MNYWLLIIPIFSALLGWIGMWLATRIFIYKIIPGRQQQLAKQIGKSVAEAFPFSDFENKLVSPENVKKIMPVVEEHVDDFLRNKLKEKMPVIGMFIGDRTIHSLKEVFLKEIEELFPRVLQQFSGNLQKEIDIEALITDKVTTVSVDRIAAALSPAVRYFCGAAALTGFFIGVINLVIFYLIIK